MFLRASSLLVALVLVGIIAGCSDAPVTEFDAGKTALEEARTSEVAQYAPELFAVAADTLNAASVEIANQDGKFALFRDYDRSSELIAKAKAMTDEAQGAAEIKKEETRVLDSTLIAEIEALINDTKASLASAPRGKGTSVDLKMMKADVDAAGTALTAATDEFNAGGYLAARDKLQAVKAQVQTVKDAVAAAASKTTKK